MKKKKEKLHTIGRNNKVWVEYFVLNIVVLLGLIRILHLWNTNIFLYPLISGGSDSDALQVIFNTAKLKETGLFGYSIRSSYPYYAYMSDFPSLGIVELFFRWILVSISGNAVATVNILYLVGYNLAATASYWVIRKLGVSQGAAGVVSILYAFLPYHFMRGISHLGFSMYWPIPILVYFCVLYIKGEAGYVKGNRGWLTPNNIIHIVVLVFLGGKTIYYTYFSCFFLCMVILILAIRKEKWVKIRQVFVDLGVILGTFLLTVIPYLINISMYGSNSGVFERQTVDVEKYGLKLGHLLMPVRGHRILSFAKISSDYNELPLTSENQFATLGILLALGFLCLLVEVVRRKHDDEDIYACSVLNIGCLLLATIGGISSIIALFFAEIRCYNRLSIFIAFLAAIALTKCIDRRLVKIKKWWMYWSVCLLLVGIGLFDQTTVNYVPKHTLIAEEWDSDRAFVERIESMEDEGAEIYQMPYMPYPEAGCVNDIQPYDLVRGYINSDSLVWSFGCFSGRQGDIWNSYVATLDVESQVKNIYLNGFDGIYLDSYGYTEYELAQITEQLELITAAKPIISDNERLYYYTLKDYDASVIEPEDELYAKTYMSFEDGFYNIERNEADSWVWCSGEGDINIYNGTEETITVTYDMNIMTLTQNGSYDFVALINDKQYQFSVTAGQNNFVSLPVELEPGDNVISLQSDVPCVELETDARDLAFRISDFAYSEELDSEE